MIQRYRTGSSHLATVATQLTKSGRYSEALEVLGRIEGLLTDDPRLAAVAAQCWLGLGEPARAVEILRQATLGAPQNPVLQTNLALAALAGADSDPSLLDLALEAALRAVEIDPSSRQTRLALARALVANGRSQEAVVEYRRAFESDARDPVAVIRAAHRLIAESHLSEARELLELVAGTHPERASVWAGLARIEEISGNEAEAERLLALAAAAKVQDAGDLAAATGSYAMDTSDS